MTAMLGVVTEGKREMGVSEAVMVSPAVKVWLAMMKLGGGVCGVCGAGECQQGCGAWVWCRRCGSCKDLGATSDNGNVGGKGSVISVCWQSLLRHPVLMSGLRRRIVKPYLRYILYQQ